MINLKDSSLTQSLLDGKLSNPVPSSGITFSDSTVQTTAATAGANFGDIFSIAKVMSCAPEAGTGPAWEIYFYPVSNEMMARGLSVSLSDGSSSETITSFSPSSPWAYYTTTLTTADYIYITFNGQRSILPISNP